ncbi:MAG: hypothetical protein HW421_2687 [Ignavibacteria bacterium]|nr:hypothetical protein [Ignavibacteria bacterium]
MKTKSFRLKLFYALFITIIGLVFLMPDLAEARGSFGGGRSFGGSRGFGGSKSFGGSRKSTPAARTTSVRDGASSFGGRKMSSNMEYRQKYGTPRKTDMQTRTNAQGVRETYMVNNYGGYGSGLMTGYMLGHTSWMWSMPFHPAFYYSRPYYTPGANGVVEVYPPTFSFTKLFFTLLFTIAIIWIIYKIISAARRGAGGVSQSSFG